MSHNLSWIDLFQKSYSTPQITLVSGKGLVVLDSDGKKYLDFIAGIATNVVGHAHPKVIKAVTEQIKKLGHVSNLYGNEKSMRLASKLIEITHDKEARIFFCNSGAEANEAALKLSRKSSRNRIVATIGSFHGRTVGALSMTGQASKREPFLPLLSKIKHIPYGDISSMQRVVTKRTAMVIVEPIMGEAGVICPPEGYLKQLRALCDQTGSILVFDCVQTGMGRTGQWFGFEHEGVKPDVITLAKGLGAGLPLAAMIVLGSCPWRFEPGEHGTTFGGNPVSAAAGLAAIEVIEKEKLMKKAILHERKLKKSISKLEGIKEVRGRGLLIGIELRSPSAMQLSHILAVNGVLVNAANSTTVRIAPALTVSDREIDTFISIFTKSLQELLGGGAMSKVINSKSVAARRAKAISLIGQGLVHSQSDLVKLLAKEGFRVTQATASRDLEEIGAVRGRSTDGRSFYELRNRGQSQQSQLMPIPTNLILSVESSANIAVVRTPPGGAQLVASSLDSAGMDSIIGTIAGDDTVLVISKKATGGGELAKQLLALSKIKKSSIDRRS